LQHVAGERTFGGQTGSRFDGSDEAILEKRKATFEKLSDVEVADSSQEWEADAAEYEPECGRGKDSQEHCAEADRQFELLQTEPGFVKEQRGPEGAGESTGEQQQSVGE
jgi:hypothetical protein